MAFPGGAAQRPRYLTAGVQVQAAGRLVTQQQGQLYDNDQGDRHSLLLTAGQLSGETISHFG